MSMKCWVLVKSVERLFAVKTFCDLMLSGCNLLIVFAQLKI